MRRKIRTIVIWGAGLFFLPACHVDNLGLHGCPTRYTREWVRLGLDVEHSEPTRCPVYIPSPGTVRQTGAMIIDGGDRDGSSSFLQVKDNAGTSLNATNDIFSYDAYNRWATQPRVSYPAGRIDLKPDEAFYYIALYGGHYLDENPKAWMTLTYTDRVQAAIGGPALVSSGSSATYTANVTAGSAPFQYRWYVDWDSVGSGSSYTTTLAGGGEVELRLDVIDARGEAASRVKVITINECPDGQKVC